MTDTCVERIYTVTEVAQRYRVRPGWVTDHCTGKRQPHLPGMKIGKYHHRGGTVDPDTMDRHADLEDERVLREGIRRYFPDADGPTMGMKTCLFTNTSDEHFIIDFVERDPRVAIAAGFSGHGFKFCSVVGEILADLALDGGTRHDISLFALNRFAERASGP